MPSTSPMEIVSTGRILEKTAAQLEALLPWNAKAALDAAAAPTDAELAAFVWAKWSSCNIGMDLLVNTGICALHVLLRRARALNCARAFQWRLDVIAAYS